MNKRLGFFCTIVVALFGLLLSSSDPYQKEPSPYIFPELREFPPMPYSKENPVTIEGAELGRYLFYDPILSKDRSISCAHCHQQEQAFSDSPVEFSRGVNLEINNRNTPPLFNLAWYNFMFWDGKVKTIEEQVFHPVRGRSEMNLDWKTAVERIQNSDFYPPKFEAAFGSQKIDSTLIALAIAQFERTLISYNSKYDKALRMEVYLSAEEYEGFILANDQTKGDCLHCHTTDSDPLGTTLKFSNNGLDAAKKPEDYLDPGKAGISGNPKDAGWFKIPSLRNVAVTGPYMHDGRFSSLEEVLDFYSDGVNQSFNIDSKMQHAHKGGVHLTEDEKRKIILFLHTLTDSVFLTNPEFSNPFGED